MQRRCPIVVVVVVQGIRESVDVHGAESGGISAVVVVAAVEVARFGVGGRTAGGVAAIGQGTVPGRMAKNSMMG